MAPKPKEVSVELLEERIRRDGVVKAGGVLKVDAFLNHQMDIELFSQMAEEWKRLFAGKPLPLCPRQGQHPPLPAVPGR